MNKNAATRLVLLFLVAILLVAVPTFSSSTIPNENSNYHYHYHYNNSTESVWNNEWNQTIIQIMEDNGELEGNITWNEIWNEIVETIIENYEVAWNDAWNPIIKNIIDDYVGIDSYTDFLMATASYIIGLFNDTHYYGQDGSTGKFNWLSPDASHVIQLATENGGTIFIRKGIYDISTAIIPTKSVTIEGEAGCTILRPTVDTEIFKHDDTPIVFNLYNLIIDDMNGVTTNAYAINVSGIGKSVWQNIQIYRYANGIYIWGSKNKRVDRLQTTNIQVLSCRSRGIYLYGDYLDDNQFSNTVISSQTGEGEIGLYLEATGHELIGGNQFSDLTIIGNYGFSTGIYIHGWWEVWFSNVICDGMRGNGIYIRSKTDLQAGKIFFVNVWSSSNRDNGLHIKGTSSNLVETIKVSNGFFHSNTNYGISVEYCKNSDFDSQTPNNGYPVKLKNYESVKILNNPDFVTENSGTEYIISSSRITFNHGLAGTPTLVLVSFDKLGCRSWKWSATSTQITITLERVGSYGDADTFKLYWKAEYKP